MSSDGLSFMDAGRNTVSNFRVFGSTNRLNTHWWPIAPGFDADRIRSGTFLSGPSFGFRRRENKKVYCVSVNVVNSSKAIRLYSDEA